MNLTLGIIIDGLSAYKPIAHKIGDAKALIRGFHYYTTDIIQTDPDYLYVINAGKTGNIFGKSRLKHIIISGAVPKILPEEIVTLIQIKKNIPVETIVQTGNALFALYDAWYNSLLMAVINHKPIDTFLNIAAQRLANPILIMNNNLSIIGTAGSIKGNTKGTIWEKVNVPGFVLDNFYTPEEIRKISLHIAQKSEQIIDLRPANDLAHFTLGINIWIEDRLYGAIGTVDMNEPLTDGQKETFVIVAKVLKLYFQNHSVYMQIAEDKANWVNSLLEGVKIPSDIINNYLYRFQWKLDDHFCVVTFTASSDLKIPIISLLDIKQINDLFSDALVSVYAECIVIIIRCIDKKPPHGKKKSHLEQFLKKDSMLRCGVSMVFNNFLYLRYYFIQSKFAASQCKPPASPAICLYEDYQANHIIKTLSLEADTRCFCHPGVLSLWESENESHKDIVNCLYHYFLKGRNVSAAADAIHIHRNTLIYRLEKAEKILNVDIKQLSAKQAFLFIVSCFIVQYL